MYIKKEERSQINKLTLHLQKLEKLEQTKIKANRRKGITKTTAEINQIENRKKINETESWFVEKINKIEKLLANIPNKKKREKSKLKSEMEERTLQQMSQK